MSLMKELSPEEIRKKMAVSDGKMEVFDEIPILPDKMIWVGNKSAKPPRDGDTPLMVFREDCNGWKNEGPFVVNSDMDFRLKMAGMPRNKRKLFTKLIRSKFKSDRDKAINILR